MMDRCLRDRALFRLSEGDGTPAEHAHVAVCDRCIRRVRTHDAAVAAAVRVLRDAPLPRRTSRLALAPILLPIAATALFTLGLTWWTTHQSALWLDPARSPATVQLAAVSFDDFHRALGGDDDADDGAPDSDTAYLGAALGGGSPCEGAAASLDPRCE